MLKLGLERFAWEGKYSLYCTCSHSDHCSCTYVPLNANELVIAYTKNAFNGLPLYNVAKKSTVELDLGLVDIQHNALRRVSDTKFAVAGGSATAPMHFTVSMSPNRPRSYFSGAAQISPLTPQYFPKPKPLHIRRPMAKI